MLLEFSYNKEFTDIINSVSEEVKDVWGISKDKLDLNKFLTNFINGELVSSLSVDANANVEGKSVAVVLQEVAKPFLKLNNLFLIWKMARKLWGEEKASSLIRSILSGDVYPNDLVLFSYVPYCWNFSAVDVAIKGLPFIPRVPSSPAKHADSFMQHVIQLLMFASNHQSGATGIAGLIPIWSIFVKHDNLSENQIKQQFQWFVYSINQPVRYSYQSPFVNITIFDRPSMSYLYKDIFIPQINEKFDLEFAYKVQKLCIEAFIEDTQRSGNIFTFPILTANITVKNNEFIDDEFVDWVCDMNSKYGNFNFFFVRQSSKGYDNFALASCCRLLNKEQIFNTTFGAGGEAIGGIGSVVINLPRVGALYKQWTQRYGDKYNLDVFYNILSEFTTKAQDLLLIRREFIKKRIRDGLLPLYTHGFMDLNRQFLIVGINGLFECVKTLCEALNIEFDLDSFLYFASRILDSIKEWNKGREEAYKKEFNEEIKFAIEQVPAEVLSSKLAQLDKIANLNSEYLLYSNQWMPLTYEVPFIDRLFVAGELDKYCNGGAIVHINTEAPLSKGLLKRLLKEAVKNGVSYIAINYDITRCNNCHTIFPFKALSCENCGSSDLDYYYRVVGFITNVKRSWIPVRQQEYEERVRYHIEEEKEVEKVA